MKWLFLFTFAVCIAHMAQRTDAGAADDVIKKIKEATMKKCDSNADVVFLVDASFSLSSKNFKRIKSFTAGIVKSLAQLSPKTFRIGVIRFSTKAKIVVNLKNGVLSNPEHLKKVEQKINNIRFEKGMTDTGLAMRIARVYAFSKSNGHRQKADKVIVLITDGNANGKVSVKKEKVKLENNFISLVALGVGKTVSSSKLQKLTKKSNVIMVKGFDQLGSVTEKLAKMLCRSKTVVKSVRKTAGAAKRNPAPATSRKAVIKKACKLVCPKNKRLIFTRNPSNPCMCVPKKAKSAKKPAKGKPLLYPSSCKNTCDDPKKVLNRDCKCVCKRKCHGLFILDKDNCKCRCTIHCKMGFRLVKKICTCVPASCAAGTKLSGDKCVPNTKRVCEKGHVFSNSICKKGKCPSGEKVALNGVCVKKAYLDKVNKKIIIRRKKKCMYGILVKGVCVAKCKKTEYYHKKVCKDLKLARIACSAKPNMVFNPVATGCPRTCKVPVSLTKCKKERGPRCECAPGHYRDGGRCIHASQCRNKPICLKEADIGILMDDTFSIGQENFYLIKQFARDVIQAMDLSKQKLAFTTLCNPKKRAKLFRKDKEYIHKGQLLKRLEAMSFSGQVTLFGEALAFFRNKVFTKEGNMREHVPRILIILTDGSRDDGFIDQYYEARKLREKGVRFIIFGVGSERFSSILRFFRSERLRKLAGAHGSVNLYGLNRYREIFPLLNRLISFKGCGEPVCPLPILYEGKCVGEFRSISRRVYYHPKGQYRCHSKIEKDYKRIRCACPKEKSVTSKCKKQFKTITQLKYRISKGVCYEAKKSIPLRCGCPESRVIKGICAGQFSTDRFIKYVPYIKNGATRCRKEEKTKSIRCACPHRLKVVDKCLNNFKIVHITRFKFKKGKCPSKQITREKRCSCPHPTFTATKCRKGKLNIRGYFQFVRKNSNGCRTDVWIKRIGCKKLCTEKLDLTIIVDSSDSVKLSNFNRIKGFLVELVKKYDISRTKTRVTLLVFSSKGSIRLIFPFMAFFKKSHMIERIKALKYRPGATTTGSALKEFRQHVARFTSGLRSDSRKVILLITDGAANDKKRNAAVEESRKLRALGFRMITIGIGIDIQKKMLKKIASEPYQKNIFLAKFNDINSLISSPKSPLLRLHCDTGRANRFTAMRRLKQHLLDHTAKHEAITEATLRNLGFVELPMHDLVEITMTIAGDLAKMTGTNSPVSRKKLENVLKSIIAKRLGIKRYEVHGFHLKSVVSDIVKQAKGGSDKAKKRRKRAAKEEKKAKEAKKTDKKAKKTDKKAKKTDKKDKKTDKKAKKASKKEKKADKKEKKSDKKKKKSDKKDKKDAKSKVAKADKVFHIGFLVQKQKVKKLKSITTLKILDTKYKVTKILETMPSVRRVYGRACYIFKRLKRTAKWYNRQLIRLNIKRKDKFIKKAVADMKTIKADLEKAEGLQKKGRNKKSLAALKNTTLKMLALLSHLFKGPSQLRKSKNPSVKSNFKTLNRHLRLRTRSSHQLGRSKALIELLTKAYKVVEDKPVKSKAGKDKKKKGKDEKKKGKGKKKKGADKKKKETKKAKKEEKKAKKEEKKASKGGKKKKEEKKATKKAAESKTKKSEKKEEKKEEKKKGGKKA